MSIVLLAVLDGMFSPAQRAHVSHHSMCAINYFLILWRYSILLLKHVLREQVVLVYQNLKT